MTSTRSRTVRPLLLVCFASCAALAAATPLSAQNAADERGETVLKIFQLKHLQPDANLMSMLATIADEQVRFAPDEDRKVVVATGTSRALAVVEAFLSRVDADDAQPATDQGARELQMRLVWLVGGLADDAAAIPPPDLEIVTRELEKMGITNLTMAAQLVVNCTEGQEFSVSGTAKVNEPCTLKVAGLLGGERRAGLPDADLAKESWLRLQISATAAGGEQLQHFCQLQTTVKAPIGRGIVLGVTPVQSKPSVFVLQLQRPATPDN